MTRKAWILWMVAVLLITFKVYGVESCGGVAANVNACLNLFEQTDVKIISMQTISDLPVFGNPFLSVTFQIASPKPAPIGIEVNPYLFSNRREDAQMPYCPLVIVGAADEKGQLEPYIRIEVNDKTPHTVQLYAFCRDLNLPGGLLGGYPFPSRSDSLYDSALDQDRFSPITDDKLHDLISRAVVNPPSCKGGDDKSLTLNSLATQFAIFILNTPDDKRDRIWEEFDLRAKNPIYDRDKKGIYCLLGISEPLPTATFTSTFTPPPYIMPTGTATPTPTATPFPLMNDRFFGNNPIFPNNLTLGEFLFLSTVALVGFVILMSLLRTRRRVVLLLTIIAAALVLILVLQRRSAQAQDVLPDTKSPGLMMVILLDDSSTMMGISSITTSGRASTGRQASDPQNYRSEAAIDLIKQLQIDQQTTHQVAVLKFSNTDTEPVWLSDYFVPVGGGLAPSDSYNNLIQALKTPRKPTERPGDTSKALDALKPIFSSKLEDTKNTFKPVIVLITDDVPIAIWGDSPWMQEQSPNWSTYITNFKQKLKDLGQNITEPYDGFCSSPQQGVTLVTFGIGAANWVTKDGHLDFSGNGNFFDDLTQGLGSINPFANGSPFSYRIDPLLADNDSHQLVEDFQKYTRTLMANLRCQWPINPSRDTKSQRDATYTFPVSDLFSQVYLTLDLPNAGDVHLISEDGQDQSAKGMRQPLWDDHRIIWTIKRDDFEKWSGVWTLKVSNTTDATLTATADVDLSDLSVQVATRTEGLSPGMPNDFGFTLLQHGRPVVDQSLLTSVKIEISDGTANDPFPIDMIPDKNGYYKGIINGEAIQKAGQYNLVVRLDWRQDVAGINLPQSTRLNSTDPIKLNITTGLAFNLDDLQPRYGTKWECKDGVEKITFPFKLEDKQANPESIGSYTRVEVYYPLTETPVAVLKWDLQNSFVGDVPCERLDPLATPQMIVQAILPNGTPTPYAVNFTFDTPTPTITPTPSLTPTATSALTATLTPTPVPPVPTPLDDLKRPPLSWLLIAGGAIVVALIGLRLLGFVFGMALPLNGVILEKRYGDQIISYEPVLEVWKRFVPFLQNRQIYSENDNNKLFLVTGEHGGARLAIKPFVDLIIDNERVPALSPKVISTNERITIVFSEYTYTLINRKAGRE